MPVIPMFSCSPISLSTPRLMLGSLVEQDWPLFLQLHQDPDVQRYIADPQGMAEIRDCNGLIILDTLLEI